MLGYFIEVPARHADALMAPDSGFTHRQTMAGAVRFNSLALHEEASRIAEAGGHALAAEEAHFEELVAKAVAARGRSPRPPRRWRGSTSPPGRPSARRKAAGAGPRSSSSPASRSKAGAIRWSRRRCAQAGERFVANDCALGPSDRLWLIGGPNMGGKSTFLRQNALIVLLAQAGGYVPAARAKVGLVDRLFSRVGASDNLARGRSTFMVEMVETAAILAQATERSFVILDEVGRGTSTYDGLALAWAVVEAVHEKATAAAACSRRITTSSPAWPKAATALSLHHVRAREWKGDLVLLHEVAEGPADRSYGLAVAKLAGVPKEVVARAKSVLDRLEKGRAATGGLAAGLGDLPLFAAAASLSGPRSACGRAPRRRSRSTHRRVRLSEKLYELKRLARTHRSRHRKGQSATSEPARNQPGDKRQLHLVRRLAGYVANAE